MGTTRQNKRNAVVLSSNSDNDVEALPLNPAIAKAQRSTTSSRNAKLTAPTTPRGKKTRKNVAASPSPQKSQTSQASPSQKPKTKPIYSFFNAATSRQQVAVTSNKQASKRGGAVVEEEEDIIVDNDSLDEELANLSETKFGSSYPLPVRRKRKINHVEDGVLTEQSSIPRGSQLFKKTATEQNNVHGSKQTLDQRPWTEKYGPVNLDELAVHKKKVQNVRTWLHDVLSGRDQKRLLILKGSAGTGKTTTINLLSSNLGLQINEWRTSGTTSSDEGFLSMSAQFEDFVARTGTFGTLDITVDTSTKQSTQNSAELRQVVLIEEFPNTFSRSSTSLSSFRTAVQHYLDASVPSSDAIFATHHGNNKPVVPIIMIISESLLSTATATSDSFTAYRLLGPDILGHIGTTVIEFNAIAPTYMTKALDTIIQKEARKSGRKRAPGPSVLKRLAEIGDIRSAVSSLEFLCLRGDESSEWSGRITFTKTKRGAETALSSMEKKSLELITQRESTLGLFHSVGKVIYNKRELPAATDTPPPQPPTHLPQHFRPKVPEINVETLLNELGTDISTFIAALHENYALSTQGLDAEETLEHVEGCVESLSDADILSPDRFGSSQHRVTYAGTGTDSLRQDEISFQTSVRGLLFCLPHPVHRITPPQTAGNAVKSNAFGSKSASFQMFYPSSLRIWRRQEETEALLETVISRLRDSRTTSDATQASSRGPTMSAVESWRLNRFGGQSTSSGGTQPMLDENAPDSPNVIAPSIAKAELLLERLPYMSMLRKHKALGELDRDIFKIIRISGTTTFDLEDDEAAEGETVPEDVEQWSTDNPIQKAVRNRKAFGLRTQDNEKKVKDKMESLLLEDDDIVDD